MSIENSLWMALLTMTTIGYGDMTPKTSIGVIIGACLSIAGLVIVSLMLASLTDLFSMRYSNLFYYIILLYRREKIIDVVK